MTEPLTDLQMGPQTELQVDLKLSDMRPFIPARDFTLSREFYQALGWTVEYDDARLALLANGAHRFYLQNAYVQDWADNSMLHLTVADARACHAQVDAVIQSGRYPGARVARPKAEPYGALVTYVWDPAGVLLHLAQWDAR